MITQTIIDAITWCANCLWGVGAWLTAIFIVLGFSFAIYLTVKIVKNATKAHKKTIRKYKGR